ncbi:hypothetical protein VPHK24_0098 [Vibrio phage K24]|nr:hypothetical protein SIPHO078v2_p0083 [Vibrio phage 14E30.1]QZI92527.1 hypothetical protein SIPHO058v2_p0079 [Vibrio phage 14E30.2]
MKLETSKYLVTTDANQFILQTKGVIVDSPTLKDKSKIGGKSLSEKKYYSSLSSLFYGMVKYQLLESDEIDSFEKILDLITETRSQLEESKLVR